MLVVCDRPVFKNDRLTEVYQFSKDVGDNKYWKPVENSIEIAENILSRYAWAAYEIKGYTKMPNPHEVLTQ